MAHSQTFTIDDPVIIKIQDLLWAFAILCMAHLRSNLQVTSRPALHVNKGNTLSSSHKGLTFLFFPLQKYSSIS